MSLVTKERISLARSAWHKMVLALVAGEAELRSLGHPREAGQLSAYVNVFSQHGARHCERIEGQNGHHKDSASASTQETGEAPVDSTQATGDEEVAFGAAVTSSQGAIPLAQDDVAAAAEVPRIEPAIEMSLEKRCIVRMAQVKAALAGPQDTTRAQQLEVAQTFLSRALDLARRNHPTAADRLAAAECVMRGSSAPEAGL